MSERPFKLPRQSKRITARNDFVYDNAATNRGSTTDLNTLATITNKHKHQHILKALVSRIFECMYEAPHWQGDYETHANSDSRRSYLAMLGNAIAASED